MCAGPGLEGAIEIPWNITKFTFVLQMPVLGRCSGCNFTHSAPFGSRCKRQRKVGVQQDIISKMAECVPGSGFNDRDSEEYFAFLEQQFVAFKKLETDSRQREGSTNDLLKDIITRLERLEAGGNHGDRTGGDMGASRSGGSGSAPQVTPAYFSSLSDSIHQLSMSLGSDVEKRRTGMEYRPEFYVHVIARGLPEKLMDYTCLKPEEFLYGMLGVYKHLLVHGHEAESYLKHLWFISRHVMERNFHISACLKYDRYIVDQVLAGAAKFGDVDPVAAGLFLHGGAAVHRETPRNEYNRSDKSYRTSYARGPIVQSQQGQCGSLMHDCNKEYVPLYMPSSWPSEICFNFNSKSCTGKCMKLHVCNHCKLRHRLADCKFALRDNQSYQQPSNQGQSFPYYSSRA